MYFNNRLPFILLILLITFSCNSKSIRNVQRDSTTSSDVVGVIEANFKVDQNGEVAYSIPLDLPPGIQKMQPNLALVYGSHAPNGKEGYGWGLQGLPVIGRVGGIIALDGYSGTVAYNSDDRFTLDGERIIAISGKDGQNGTVYHTEIESWQKIISNGTAGSGPDNYTVIAKNGHQMEFGNTSDSKILADGQSSVRIWALNKVTDLNGNSMRLTYTSSPRDVNTGSTISSPGAYYPLEISYTENGAFQANRSIKFFYESRNDPIDQYEGGSQILRAARLQKVQALLRGTVVREYDLAYEYSPVTGRSRLTSITEKGVTQTLSPTNFTWQSMANNFSNSVTGLGSAFTAGQGWNSPESYPVTLADVNGDGQMDIIGFKGGTQVALAKGNPAPNGPFFDGATSWNSGFSTGGTDYTTESETPRYVADANGDGLADVIGIGKNGVSVALSTGAAFSTRGWNGGAVMPNFGINQGYSPASTYPVQVTDVNGDNMVDIVAFFRTSVQVALSQGDKFASPVDWISDFTVGQGWQQSMLRIMADVNGDRRADIVGFGQGGVYVGLAGTNSFSKSGWNGGNVFANFGISQGWIGPATFPIQMADVNGDGLMDIIGFRDHVQVSLSTGNGFTPPANWISDFTSQQGWTHNTPVQLRDVNGDGMADLVGYGTNGVVIALSNGRSFSKSNWNGGNVYPNFGVSQGWSATRNLRLVADVDGNGLSDLIGFGNTNVEVGLNPGPFPDLLTNISNGLGGEFAINYTTLADRNVYSFDGALNSNTASAQSQLNAPLPLNSTYLVNGQVNLQGGQSIVVKNYTEQNNASVNAQTYHYPFQFTYKNAAYDNQGRGWMGFAEISQQNLDLGTQQEVFYLQKFPFTGKEYQITNYCGDGSNDPNCGSGKILGRQRISYYCQPDSACNSADQALTQPFPNVYQVLQKNHFTDKYQYNQYYFSLLNVKSYDKYGNTIIDAEYGRTNQAGKDQDSSDNLFTLSYFSNDASQNIFGYVLAQKKSSSSDSTGLAGCNCGTSPTYSAADLSLQAIAYSSEMTVNTVCNWDNLRSTWDASTYAYDQYGNDTLETNPAGNATSKVIESTYQTYLDHTVSPPNSNGDRLVTHYGFDPRSGLQVGQIGPNGNANLVIIDDFGFQVAVQGPVPQGQNINKGQNRLGSFVTGSGGFAAADVVDLSMQTIIQTGSSIYVEAKELQNWANGAGYKVMYNYLDGRNRKYKEEVLQPCNANGTITSGAVFNSADKFLNKTLPHFSNAHAVAQMSTIYDAYQRPVRRSSTAGPSGQDSTVTTFAYSMDSKGLTTTETAASADAYAYSKVSFFEFFNKKQRATSITIVTDNNAQTSYTYDPMGRARTVTTPPAQNNSAGLTDSTYYDSQGRKYRTYNASLGAETYLYGSNGKVQTLTNGQGSSSFTYDNLARLIRRDFPDGRKVLLTYDSSGISNSLGQLTHISSFNTDNSTNYTSAYVYDRYGNRALEEMDIFNVKGGTQSFITTKVFDPQNRLTAITFPDQTTMYYRYNTCALDTILVGDTTLATFSNFSPFEKPGQISYGNGAQARFLYSPENKMSSHKVWAKGGSAILYDSLTWDHLNQITGIQDLRGSGTDHSQQFTYTSRRLSQASAVNTYQDIAYLYDQAGNLVQKGDVSFTYAGFQVTDGDSNGTNVFHAEYGEMGTMSLRKRGNTSQNLAYDSENRLTSVSTDGQTETYRYDYQGRRIYKADAEGNVTLYVNSEFEKVIFADNKTQTTRYAVTPWGILAALTSNGGEVGKSGIPGAGIRYIHGNNIQSTVVTTNAAGALGTRIIYQPYGGVWKMDGENDFRPKFTGKELDIGTTLYYFGGRYYDAFTGRFITADTELGANTTRQDAFNRYAYVLNNPLIFIDFNGHSPWWEDALMITADVALVTGGVALIVLTDGAAAPIIGAALLSAGVSGAIYNVSNLGHQQLAGWGIQLGVGFVTGLVTGGIGAGGAALTGAAVDAAEDAGWSAARQTALTWGGRALTGAVAGAASSVAGQMTGNLLGGHQPFYHFSGWAVLENAGAGMVGNLIAAGAVAKFGDLGIGEGAPDAESLLGRLFYEAPARVIPKWTKIIVPFTFQINKTTIKATDPQW